MDITKLSTEELMKMKAGPDMSSIPTEELMKMRAADTPDPTGSFMENVKAGGGKMLYDLARGTGQLLRDALKPSAQVLMDAEAKRPQSLSNVIVPQQPKQMPNLVADLLRLPTQADIDEARALDKPLMDTAGGKVGNIGMGVVLAAPTVLIPGANTATGAGIVGGIMGATQPVPTGDSRLVNSAIGSAVGGATQVVAGKVGQVLQNRAAAKGSEAATQQAQNATRDTALEAGRKAGYVVPPSTVKPGMVNDALESVAGKVSTAQSASVKNQGVTDTLAREALGLKKDSLLTEGSLADLRSQAGKAYQAVKDFPARFRADQEFDDAVAKLGGDFSAAAEVIPSSVKNEAVDALRRDLTKGVWTPTGLIEAIKKLRHDAAINYKSFDDPAKAALADAQRGAADAMDALIERKMALVGKPEIAEAYKAARTLIAKAHDVESALMADGHVNAQVLARIAEKKPFTDQLAVIADFAGSFPKAVQPVSKIGSPGVHAARASIGGAVGSMIGGPAGGMIGAGVGVGVPWTVRHALLSGAGQSLARPSYAAGGSTVADLLANPAVRATLPAGTVGAVFQNRAQQ